MPFTDDQYTLIINKNALLEKQLCIAHTALQASRNAYVQEYVIWKANEAQVAGYRKAFDQMNFADIQTAPMDGTEIMCLTASGLLKQAQWLTEIDTPTWGGFYNLTTNWTFPDTDPPLSWLPLKPTGIWPPTSTWTGYSAPTPVSTIVSACVGL